MASLKTREDLVALLRQLKISVGDHVILHQNHLFDSLIGKGALLIDTLTSYLGDEGTLIMIHVDSDMSDPGYDQDVEFSKRQTIRSYLSTLSEKDLMVNYPPQFMAMLNHKQVYVSYHPKVKVAAIGKYARYITRKTTQDFPYGNESAFQALYEIDPKILLDTTTIDQSHELKLGCIHTSDAVIVDGAVVDGEWRSYLDYDINPESYRLSIDTAKKVELDDLLVVSYCEAVNHFQQNKTPRFIRR